MFSKLARSAGQVIPLARTNFKTGICASARLYSAQPPAVTTSSQIQQLKNDVAKLDLLDQSDRVVQKAATVFKQLKHDELMNYLIECKDDNLPAPLSKILMAEATQAFAACPSPGVQALVDNHAAQVKQFKDLPIKDAMWIVSIQSAAIEKLSPEDRKKYQTEIVSKFPEIKDHLAEIDQLSALTNEYVAEVGSLYDRVMPPQQDILDIINRQMVVEDNLQVARETPECKIDLSMFDLAELKKKYPEGPVSVINDGLDMIKQRNMRWKELNNLYFNKERNYKDYPIEEITPESRLPNRYRFLPGTWFDAMYDKTGVTGPHIMIWGSFLYLLSKQHVNVNYHLQGMFCLAIALSYLMSYSKLSLGYKERKLRYLDKMDYTYTRARKEEMEMIRGMIAEVDAMRKGTTSAYIFEAMKENVGLQLEGEYRQRMDQIQAAVKRRLDYQVAVEVTKKSYELKHMSSWIIDSVQQSITPQLEKDILAKCFVDLKALAQKQSGSA